MLFVIQDLSSLAVIISATVKLFFEELFGCVGAQLV